VTDVTDVAVSGGGHRLIEAVEAHHFESARLMFQEYAAQLGIDLCFQGFAAELEDLPGMYGPPRGALFLVMRGATAVGCGALREFAAGVCEMKRLYVRSTERGAHLGRQVATSLMDRARMLGYREMVLDTLADMAAARSLYRSLGFRETEPYYRNPLPGVVYMKADLGGTPRGQSMRTG
jgi:ribosomal protein S18 acetylase RimI-like enzyme